MAKNDPALYDNSPLDELRDLADQMYAKIYGKNKKFTWETGSGSIIKIIDFNDINDKLDSIADDYTTGNTTQTCSNNWGVNKEPNNWTSIGQCTSNNGSQRINICSPRD